MHAWCCALLLAVILVRLPSQSEPTTQPAPNGSQLERVLAIAKARAERQRPALEAALRPFLPDLSLSYAENRPFLDRRIAEIAALGEGIAPMLLEYLAPGDDSPATRNLA